MFLGTVDEFSPPDKQTSSSWNPLPLVQGCGAADSCTTKSFDPSTTRRSFKRPQPPQSLNLNSPPKPLPVREDSNAIASNHPPKLHFGSSTFALTSTSSSPELKSGGNDGGFGGQGGGGTRKNSPRRYFHYSGKSGAPLISIDVCSDEDIHSQPVADGDVIVNSSQKRHSTGDAAATCGVTFNPAALSSKVKNGRNSTVSLYEPSAGIVRSRSGSKTAITDFWTESRLLFVCLFLKS